MLPLFLGTFPVTFAEPSGICGLLIWLGCLRRLGFIFGVATVTDRAARWQFRLPFGVKLTHVGRIVFVTEVALHFRFGKVQRLLVIFIIILQVGFLQDFLRYFLVHVVENVHLHGVAIAIVKRVAGLFLDDTIN